MSIWRHSFVLVLSAGLIGFGLNAVAENNRPKPEKPVSNKTKARSNKSNLVGHGGPIKAVAVSADGKYALTGSFDYSMMYWDLSGKVPKQLKRFDDQDGAVNAVLFMPGRAQALSAGDDGAVVIWDLTSRERLHRFTGHSAKVVSIAVSSDGKWAASASWDHTVRLWDLEQKKPGPVLKGHKGLVNAVAFAKFEGRLVVYSASQDGTIRRWNVASGMSERLLYRHGWGLNVLAVIPSTGQLLIGALNGSVGLVDPLSGELVTKLASHEGPVLSLALSSDFAFAALGGGDGKIHVWSTANWSIAEQYNNPYGPVWALAFTLDNRHLYFGGLDDFAAKWQISPRKPFEPVDSRYPRRFQRNTNLSLGERQFARKCSICHTLTKNGANRAGPTLYKIFGRKAGSLPGYTYSKALKESGIIWSEKTIEQLFAQGPHHFTPGSKMPLQKIADEKKRHALISFLKQATNDEDGSVKK